MNKQFFIWKILATSIVACFVCIVQNVSAQTYDLKEVEVNGHTMYMSTNLRSVYQQKPDTLVRFYYNNDTSMVGHSMYKYKDWEGAEQELFHLQNSAFEALLYDLLRTDNDSMSISYYKRVITENDSSIRYYERTLTFPIARMFDPDEQECLIGKLKHRIGILLYLSLDGKIANVRLEIPIESYGTCLSNDKIYAILKFVMEANIVLPRYTKFLKTNHEALEKYQGQWNFTYAIPLSIKGRRAY